MPPNKNSHCGGESPPLDLNLISADTIQNLSDHDIQVTIRCISKEFNTGMIEAKESRSKRKICNDEVGRRSLARINKVVGACHRNTKTKYVDFSELSEEVGSNITLTYFNSQEKSEDKTNAAFSEELSSIRADKPKSFRENVLQLQKEKCRPRQKSCVPPREPPSVRYPRKDRQSFLYRKFPDFRFPESSLSRVSKRRASASQCSINSESEEVQHVVLSDDEDVQSIRSVQEGDISDSRRGYKIYYPSRDNPECVELSLSDQECLNPGSYLSSPIMNFYIQYLQKLPSSIAMQKEECCVFNTYFYSKLEEAITCKDDGNAAFLKLRRWWKGVDLFRKAYIFLPIHGEMHWSLVIICFPAKEDESGPIILHLDSLEVHASSHILLVISRYLLQEWKYINQNNRPLDLPISETVWKSLPWMIEKEKIRVPQQKNEYDCGLFVLYFMQRFIEEAPERLRKQDLSMFGKKWFLPEEASGLREKVKNMLICEFERNKTFKSGG